MKDETIDLIKEIFMNDEDFKTKFAFLSDGKQAKIIEGSVGAESQAALIECFLTIAAILNNQNINDELRVATDHVLSLSQSSTGETIH
jgi:hypothetical protein